MTHDHNHTDPEHAALAALIARLAQRDPVQAAALRQAGMIMASLDAALAPHGLVPLHDDPQRAAQDAAQVSENLGEAGYTGAQTSQGFTVTDAAGQVIAETANLAALRTLAAWAGVPVGTGYRWGDLA